MKKIEILKQAFILDEMIFENIMTPDDVRTDKKYFLQDFEKELFEEILKDEKITKKMFYPFLQTYGRRSYWFDQKHDKIILLSKCDIETVTQDMVNCLDLFITAREKINESGKT